MHELSLAELRKEWAGAWKMKAHARIGRSMLEKSLLFKTQCLLSPEQQARLDHLVRHYKRNPRCFDEGCAALKPGMRLVRNWKGQRHSVLVKAGGFEYRGEHYSSLSQVANTITGSRWNGHVFFGVKK